MSKERDFSQITNEALALLQRGQNLPFILARYPEDADRLAPLLETAQIVMRTSQPQAPAGIEATSKAQMMQGLNEKITDFSQHKEDILDDLGTGLQAARGKRLILAIMAMVIIFIILSTIHVATMASLPGSPLYPIKLALQDTRVLLTLDPTLKQIRSAHYYALRMEDLERALELNRILAIDAQATMTAMPTPQPMPTWPFPPLNP